MTSNDPDEMTEAELREEVKRRRGTSRRRVLRGGLTVAALGALGIYGVGGVAADPQGVYPVESDDPFAKIRADRIRYVSRTSQPSSPSSGRVITYVDDGDLP
jgi:hypothetical protein